MAEEGLVLDRARSSSRWICCVQCTWPSLSWTEWIEDLSTYEMKIQPQSLSFGEQGQSGREKGY